MFALELAKLTALMERTSGSFEVKIGLILHFADTPRLYWGNRNEYADTERDPARIGSGDYRVCRGGRTLHQFEPRAGTTFFKAPSA